MTEYAFRTFSLPCSGGLCKSETLPSCTEPLEWDESVIVSHQCQETPFNNDTLLCSQNGTKEVKLRSKVGGGVLQEVGHPSLPGLHPFARLDSLGTLHNRPSCRREGDNEVSLEGKQGSWIRNGKRRYGVHTMDMQIVQP